jgi:hypothetical protein
MSRGCKMRQLTKIIVKDTTQLLEGFFDRLNSSCTQIDYLREAREFKNAINQIERLSFYDRETFLDYAIRFNEFIISREDIQPYKIRDMMYLPQKDKDASFKILNGVMSKALLAVEDNPKSFEKKEIYLYLLQKLSPFNFPVSNGYAELFNQLQKNKKAKRGAKHYQILDRGNGNYVLGMEEI